MLHARNALAGSTTGALPAEVVGVDAPQRRSHVRSERSLAHTLQGRTCRAQPWCRSRSWAHTTCRGTRPDWSGMPRGARHVCKEGGQSGGMLPCTLTSCPGTAVHPSVSAATARSAAAARQDVCCTMVASLERVACQPVSCGHRGCEASGEGRACEAARRGRPRRFHKHRSQHTAARPRAPTAPPVCCQAASTAPPTACGQPARREVRVRRAARRMAPLMAQLSSPLQLAPPWQTSPPLVMARLVMARSRALLGRGERNKLQKNRRGLQRRVFLCCWAMRRKPGVTFIAGVRYR